MIICEFEDGKKAKLRHVVIDTIVAHDNKILLIKRTKKILEGGKWGLVGGYVERDETLKHAVEREVFEETGYRIKNLIFMRIKDNPMRLNEDRQNVAFVFIATATEKEGEMDWESDEMKWFDFASLPKDNEMAFDHKEDLEYYKKYLDKKISLPILSNL